MAKRNLKCDHRHRRIGLKVKMAAGVSWRYPEQADPTVDTERCDNCGAWLSLGESWDDQVCVRIEIAAVEHLARLDEPGAELGVGECLGYCEAFAEANGGDEAPVEEFSDANWAGWLACEIDSTPEPEETP